MTAGSHPNDHQPSATLGMLHQRAQLLRQLRTFFDSRGFLEVETPLASHDTVVDRHLDPIPLTVNGSQMWLQTSPEFGMKRLVVAGATAIYQITRAFRDDERGQLHNPEFTILEWYRVGDTFDDGIAFLEAVTKEMLGVTETERLSYQQAFLRYANIDPLTASTEDIICRCRQQPATMNLGDDRDSWLNFLLADAVEPHLGAACPTILYHYPSSQAALARVSEHDSRVAERFELYVRGVEVANGYHELCDPDELLQRSTIGNHERMRDGKIPLPAENRLLDAMRDGLPPCTGVALGVDRLLMLRAGCTDIAEVLAFPFERA